MSVSPGGLCGTWPGGKRSCHDTAPQGTSAASVPRGNQSFPKDKTSSAPGALMAHPCPPPHTGVVVGRWRLSFFILSGGQTQPAAELCDFVHFGGSLLGIWPFLTWSWTSSAAFLKDDCSDEAINYKADLTVCSGLNKFASLTFPDNCF